MINPERYRQIDELFRAALEIQPNKRSEFVSSACSGDQSLKGEVEALIAFAEREWDLIDGPVPEIATLFLPEQLPDLAIGESLGHYEILSLLGAGGMGHVYLAQDSRLGRRVALKLLPLEYTKNESRLRRFRQEVRAASALNHPGILTIHDIAEIDGRHLIATEFIDGETLRQRLKRSPLTVPEILDFAIQVTSALSAAHEAGIVHRDIKPENIMLRRDGYVKVLDFGLAKLTQQHEPALDARIPDELDVSSGLVMGTVKYMSPEQAQGQSVDPRSDIFSLGVVLYETVAGLAPFNGESADEVIKSILNDNPLRLTEHQPDLPEELQNVITKALDKDRSQRYQTAEDLLIALTAIRQERESETRPQIANTNEITAVEHVATGIKRRKTGVAAAFGVVLIVTTSAGYAVYKFLGRNVRSSSQNVRLARLTATGKAFSAAISPDGKYVAFVTSESNQPKRGRETLWVREVATNANAQIFPPSLQHYSKLTFSPDGNYLYYVASDNSDPEPTLYQIPAGGGVPKRILTGAINPQTSGAISISPDGNQFVFVRAYPSGESAIVVANADGSDERVIASRQDDSSFGRAVWSPDGQRIACSGAQINAKGSYHELIEINANGGSEKLISARRWGWIDDVFWLSDGSGLLITADDGEGSPQQIWEISYSTGDARNLTTDFLGTYSSLSLSKDSSVLVATRNETVQHIWTQPADDAGGAKQITSGAAADGWAGLAWTPDGRIAYSSIANGHQDIWIMDADGGNQRQLTVNLGSNGAGLSVSTDGRYVAFVSDQAGHGNIWRIKSDGTGPKQLTSGDGETNPVFLPDGWISYPCEISGKPARCKVSIDGGEPEYVTGPYSDMMRFSPDGRLIAFIPAGGQKGKRIGVIPVDESEPPRIFDLPPDSIPRRMQWSADSRALTYIDSRRTSNIWNLPIDGRKAVKLTDFKDRSIPSFAWSRDGKQLAMARSMTTNDVVLMKNFR
jgi:serine/threonine protein kinase